ncbi:hypothetical protein M407DRAFT_32117 [Tulasnella calospora MUT 4182]|uniref:F-box domain-containing protein n=1 Tax=Tulasnella calospora MUT 4182 TaxID=1051891 RepID=A0A0C3PTU0_9AGAM|nr:hypothetical protein M407DRAFT_32117 [Tulasnella calospora MUT 4182]
MPAIPQNIIYDATELILNHLRQTSQYLEGAPNPGGNDEKERQGIDREIDAMEETLTSLQTSLKTRITQRKKERNRLIRFNQLPLEVASNILWLSIVDPWQRKMSWSFIQRLQTISSVCSSWRNLVEGSPRFWSIIEFSCPKPAILHFLRKSESSGLEIKCFSDTKYNCAPSVERFGLAEGGYLDLIAPHTGRIRSLILSAPTTDGLFSILERPAPMLQELRLNFVHCIFVQPLDLFCGQAGRLRDVALENIPVRWDSEVLVGLRSLKIKGKLEYSPTEGQVRRLLEANPGLEKMDIEDVMVTEHFGDDAVECTGGGKPSRVVMSKMQELKLFNLQFELAQAILANVEIPSIRHLKLRCLFGGQPASRLLGPNMKHLVPPLLQRSKGSHQAEITFGKASVGLGIYLPRQENSTIRIELKNTIPVSGFEWLAENFFLAEGLPSVSAADTFQVSLKFGDNFDMEGGAFIPILDRLNAVKVKVLTIESGCKHGEELINYLGVVKGDSHWPLPHLMSLTVEGSAAMATHLLTTLQHRKHDAPTNETPTAPRPVTLEVLNIEGLRGVERKMEKTLAEYISSSGTLVRGSRRPLTYWRGFGDDWEDFDEDNEDEDIYDTYGPLAMVSPYVW